jgi:uncharacterized repeat protein (TIGR03803 family)
MAGFTLSSLYSFCRQPNCSDGAEPGAGLILAADGNFYGTTSIKGAGHGTVFRTTQSGTLTTLHSFTGTDGSEANALIQATDGSFYGTAYGGGANNSCTPGGCGTVFKISPSGMLTTLYNFCSRPNCIDGFQPGGGLVQGADGNFYGTTYGGGTGSGGTIFKITASGALTTLYSFCSAPNCADGFGPGVGLIQATDGNFYGTTVGGGTGAVGGGTIFKIAPNGMLTTLYSFCSQSNCADGSNPEAALLQATDGNFYGTTANGGNSANCHSAPAGCGTVFRLSTGLGPFVETQPTSGSPGTPVTILGSNLAGTTTVSFNGTPATFTASASEISTSVPAGATTGTVQVTTPAGTLTSNADFQVTGPIQFVTVTPCRLIDTRKDGGPILGGTSRNFILPQLGACNVPASAAAYSLNVTVVPQGPLGYLTIWPQGEVQPLVSTMNSGDGRTKANAVIVPSGNNAVSVYVTNTTDVILDIDGYFAPPSASTLQFYPLTPCRVADTRKDTFPPGLGTPHLSQGVARDFPVLNNTTCIPPTINAAAYSFNFTAIPYPSLGYPLAYLEVWPTGEQPQHPVSTLNNPTATYVANAAIVPAGSSGEITVYPSDNTDLAIDINGYFAAPGGQGALSLYPTVPCRVIDTRKIGSGQPFSGTLTPPVDVVDSPCGIPATAQAYVFNATVVPSPNLSYLTLWPDGEGQPIVSTLNAADGWITSNMAIVPNHGDGKVDAYASGVTQLILDISSYFAP